MQWIFDADRKSITGIQTEKGEIPVLSWGFEVGDWYSFYNSHDDTGVKWKLEDKVMDIENETIRGRYRIRLSRGYYEIITNDRVDGHQINRQYKVKSLESSMLGDFVVRIALPVTTKSIGKIAGHNFQHKSENIYHQYQVPKASVEYPDKNLRIGFKAMENTFPGLSAWTYIRDEPPQTWIIHHRLLSELRNHQVWSVGPKRINTPQSIAHLLTPIAQYFWLYKEWTGINSLIPIHFQVGYLAPLKKGDTLSIETTIDLRTL